MAFSINFTSFSFDNLPGILKSFYRFRKFLSYSILPFFFKMPNIIFSVMQKPFIKCVIRQKVNRFLHSRKKLIRRFQKKRQYKKNNSECEDALEILKVLGSNP